MHNSIKIWFISLFVSIFYCCTFNSYAGNLPTDNEKPKNENNKISGRKILRIAQSYERSENYNKAIQQYELYLNKKPDNQKIIQKLSNLHYQQRNYYSACMYFEQLIKKSTNKYKDEQLFYARTLMTLQKYKDALEILEALRRNPRGFSDRNYQTLVRNYKKACEDNLQTHKEIFNEVISVEPVDQLNTPYHDVNAVLIDDETLLYTTYYFPSESENKMLEEKNNPQRKIIIAKNNKGNWEYESPMDWPINEKNIDTENGVFNIDKTSFYFTRSRKNWRGATISEIYVCNKTDNLWNYPEKLPYPINDENYTNTQPAIGVDIRSKQEIIYFVSNRPKGAGGLDIWYTAYNANTNSYLEPRNAGRRINTAGNEITPCYSNISNELYFSSDGLPGFGGYDVFKTRGSKSHWMAPILLSSPINTSYDDIYLSTNYDNKNNGFLSSNRPKTGNNESACCEDLYAFKIERPSVNFVVGIVINQTNRDFDEILKSKMKIETELKKDGEPIPGVLITLYEKEETNNKILIAQTETDIKGQYFFETDPGKDYEVVVRNLGHFDKKRPFSTKRITSQDTLFLKDIFINYIETDLKLSTNVLFEFGKSKLHEQAYQHIDTTLLPILKLMPNAIIEIGAHTDSIGSTEYNLRFSEKRAQAVKDYLITKGIQKERIVSKGYGEAFPIAPNSLPNGQDNPIGRETNRRTEIKIIGSLENNNQLEN